MAQSFLGHFGQHLYYVQDRLSHARTRSYSVRRLWVASLGIPPAEITQTIHERLAIEAKTGEYDEMLTVRISDRARSVEVDADIVASAVSE